jgi:dolichyl-phosphate beta-glucosyltransferase
VAGTIVIPAYNERERIARAMESARVWFDANDPEGTIIVVDDGSSDSTPALASAAGAHVISFGRNRGKGAAVRAGMLAAEGDPILFCDADLSTPLEAWPSLRARHDDGADVVIGVRTKDTITVTQPWYRVAIGKFGLLVVWLLLGLRVRDTQCGFKSFRSAAAKAVFEKCVVNGFGFDIEALVAARTLGLRVDQVDVPWANDPRSKVRPVKDAVRTFIEVLRIMRYRWLGRYRA